MVSWGCLLERGRPMPDIQLRFNKDMLVLSAPVDATLARQGIDAARDREYLNLMEPDSIRDALNLEVMAGAQCVVTTTEDITQARLAHLNMDSDSARLAQAALKVARDVKPQHVLAEIGPCGLPLDASSKASLNEHRAQYAGAARAFEGGDFDAYFLNGFTSITDLKCALMGVAQVSGKPVFASMTVGVGDCAGGEQVSPTKRETPASAEDMMADLPFEGYELLDTPTAPPISAARRASLSPDAWPEAVNTMADLGVAVIGFETAEPVAKALEYATTALELVQLPVLAQLRVSGSQSAQTAKNLVPLADIDEYTPDTLSVAAVKLYGAGVQFLRATGQATAACTGSLAATVMGLDVRSR